MSSIPMFIPNRNASTREAKPGIVYLVGAGPGDPDLLTVRAVRLLGQAEVVVYDHLVSQQVLDYIHPDAERIYVGKEKDRHTLPQDQINTLLVRLARQQRRVVRLKGGDPFIFGRGGEEVEELLEHGVRFEIVPGITAASGVSSYAGIPLTHRDHAQSCLFATGHLKDGSLDLDWEALVRPHQTAVIYMGLGALGDIAQQLIAHGAPAATPVALVEQGTTQRQRVVIGALDDIGAKAAAAGLKSPCIIIIGAVVTLHDKLAWFHPEQETAQPVAA